MCDGCVNDLQSHKLMAQIIGTGYTKKPTKTARLLRPKGQCIFSLWCPSPRFSPQSVLPSSPQSSPKPHIQTRSHIQCPCLDWPPYLCCRQLPGFHQVPHYSPPIHAKLLMKYLTFASNNVYFKTLGLDHNAHAGYQPNHLCTFAQ